MAPLKNNKDKKKRQKSDNLQTPRGMRDIVGDDVHAYNAFFEKASEIAVYYGFRPIETPIIEKEELFTRSVGEFTDIVGKEMYKVRSNGNDKLVLRPEGTAPIVRAYIEQGMHALPQPVMLYYYGSFFRHENPQRGRFRQFKQFGVEVLGSDKSVIDALVIKVTETILKECGVRNLSITINSLGDKECRADYKKALIAYYRKSGSKLSAHAKDLLKNNPLRLLDSKDPSCIELNSNAPASMDYLTGSAKQHFKEVLEYLESMGVEYEIDNHLVRGLDYYSRTVFEFVKKSEEEGDTTKGLEIAGGGRYDYLAKAIGSKKNVPACGASCGVDRILMESDTFSCKPRIIKKPKAYFIQLGFEAKLKSLHIIDALREAKIPIEQSLAKDSLAAQLGIAERMGIKWVIILGQKEVLDNTVIVRNMVNRSQETVPQKELATYFKRIIAR